MGPDLLQRHRSLRVLVSLLIIVLAFYILSVLVNVLSIFGDIILMFFLAWVITFILEPVTSALERRGFSRVLAVSLVFLALIVVLSGAIVLTVYAIAAQVTSIAHEIQTALTTNNISTLAEQATRLLERFGIPAATAQNLIRQATSQIPSKVGDFANSAATTAEGLVNSLLTILFDGSIVLIVAFYIMLDGGRLWERIISKLPPVFEPDIRLFQYHVGEIFGGFFRAQLIIAGLYAIATWLILLPLGQGNNGFIVAILAGIVIVLPFFGPFLSVIPPALLVILQSPPNQTLLIKLVVLIFALAAAQHIVINLLGPRIFGSNIGVDPIILFAVLLIGAKVGGVWGAFFAGPVAAVLYAMVETFYDRFAATSPLFKRTPTQDAVVPSKPRLPRAARHRKLTPVQHGLLHLGENIKTSLGGKPPETEPVDEPPADALTGEETRQPEEAPPRAQAADPGYSNEEMSDSRRTTAAGKRADEQPER